MDDPKNVFPEKIQPVADVHHGHLVYQKQMGDVVGREDRAKKIIDELELLLREIIAVVPVPESLMNRIKNRLETLSDGPKNSA